jgi:hypothetical protein
LKWNANDLVSLRAFIELLPLIRKDDDLTSKKVEVTPDYQNHYERQYYYIHSEQDSSLERKLRESGLGSFEFKPKVLMDKCAEYTNPMYIVDSPLLDQMNLFEKSYCGWFQKKPDFLLDAPKAVKVWYLKQLFYAYPTVADDAEHEECHDWTFAPRLEHCFGIAEIGQWLRCQGEHLGFVKAMLEEFGIEIRMSYHCICDKSTQLLGVIEGESMQRFMEHIGIENSACYVRCKALEDMKIDDWEERKYLYRKWEKAGMVTMPVVKRESVGPKMTYSIVTNMSNLVMNGVVVHN